MRPRDSVLVQLREAFRGSAGQTEYRPAGSPVSVRCNVYPLSSDNVELYGERGRVQRQISFHGRVWPGDEHSEITYDGGSWFILTPPVHANKGIRSQHWEVIIQKR